MQHSLRQDDIRYNIIDKTVWKFKDKRFFSYLEESLSVRAVQGIKRLKIVNDFPSLFELTEESFLYVWYVNAKTINEIMDFQARMKKAYDDVKESIGEIDDVRSDDNYNEIEKNVWELKDEKFFSYLSADLSVRAVHGIERIETVNDFPTFFRLTKESLIYVRNIGDKTINEIMDYQNRMKKAYENDGEDNIENNYNVKSDNKYSKIEKAIWEFKDKKFFSYIRGDLSVRAVHGIERIGNVNDFPSFFELTEESLTNVWNIGTKTIKEIMDYQNSMKMAYRNGAKGSIENEETVREKVLRLWNENSRKYDNRRNVSKLCRSIAKWIKYNDWDEFSYGEVAEEIITNEKFIDEIFNSKEVDDVLKLSLCEAADDKWPVVDEELVYRVSKGLPQDFINRIPITRTIRDLINEKRIEKVDYGFLKQIPDIYTAIQEDPKSDDRKKEIIIERLRGKTLEEVGEKQGLTRERIRQIEKKFINRRWQVKEDRLKSLFSRYCFSAKELESVFRITMIGYRYLKQKYEQGECPAEQALDDEEIPQFYKARLKKAIYADYLDIDGVYVPKNRNALIDFFVQHYCLDEISLDEFCAKYYFLLDLIGQTGSEKLIFPYARYAEVKIPLLHSILWKYGKRFRYYDVDSVDIEQLLKDFHFDELSEQDVEIGAQLFLDRYPDVAAEYDLRDAYELHNLLKKRLTDEQLADMNLSLSRMPNLIFGTPNREQQVLDVLEQFGSLSCDDLIKEYRKAYGVLDGTFMANYAKYAKRFLREGIYSMEVHKMTGDEHSRLKAVLTRPYYIMEEVRHIFKKVCPGVKGILNRYNLDMLGFDANDNTIYRKEYQSFIDAIMTSNQERGIIRLNQWEGQIRSYILARLQPSLDVVEFTPGQYIMLSKLEKIGVNRESLLEVSRQVKEQMEEAYFTVKSFRLAGGKTSIDCLGFDDYFLASLLRFGGVFQSLRHGNTWLFYQGKSAISLAGFIEDFMESEISISTEDILHVLKKRYGLYYKDLHAIIEVVKSEDNDLYYNRIMSRIYRDYDVYFREV